MAESERFIILPKRGIFAPRTASSHDFLRSFPNTFSTGRPQDFRLEQFGADVVIRDTAAETGPKLVEMDSAAAERLNRPDSPVRAVREVFYPLPRPVNEPPLAPLAAGGVTATANAFTVEVVNDSTGAPIPDATVVAFSNFQNRIGVKGLTLNNGQVSLALNVATIERVVATPEPEKGFWSGYKLNVPAAGTIQIRVAPLTMPFTDSVRNYYSSTNFVSGTGVKVGVLDTGCGPHADLNLAAASRNTVTGEPASQYQDGHHHGTHVAGLIGGRGTAANGIRGVAPDVPIHAYRVFAQGGAGASNYAILKAMIFAANDGCDIINLSLGGGPHNEVVEEAILDARNQGMLVVIAAGNDYRGAVRFPAAYRGAMAVSAMGRAGTFPPGSAEELQIVRPPSATVDPDEFIAHFSNVGTQVSVTAPGVGAISTLPNDKIGVLSGTSMAAPVIAGAAACLLSQDQTIYAMARNQARSDAIERLVQVNSARQGFGLIFEGFGRPESPIV
jgi:subtilisin